MPNVTVGNNVAFYVGQTTANGNTAQLTYGYQGDNNTSNNIRLGFYGNTGSYMTLLNNGNVGINKTNPAYALDINGSMSVSGNIIGVTNITTYQAVTAASYIGNWPDTNYFGIGRDASLANTVRIGECDINGAWTNNNSTCSLSVTGDVYIPYYRGIKISNAANNVLVDTFWTGVYDLLRFYTPGSQSGTIKMVLRHDGNVGIGTTVPNYMLDVNGTANIKTSLTTGALYSTNITSTNIVATNISTSTIIGSGILNSAWSPLHMFINRSTTGNASPLGSLAPNAPVGSSIATFFGQTMGNGNVGQLTFGYQGNNNTGNNMSLSFYGGGGSNITLLNNGNVGINNGSPVAALDVNGTVNINNALSSTFNSNTIGPLIMTGGNVGIGTTAPVCPLHVVYNSFQGMTLEGSSGNINMMFKNTGLGGRSYLVGCASTGASTGVGNFYIYDNGAGATRLVVGTSGNVGIGT
ncbi:MAG: hypothetical protein EBZ49_11200, partial [Proteobacteria bacterium]|nr:hypothetical protein [Pseudomonadota bacterium]